MKRRLFLLSLFALTVQATSVSAARTLTPEARTLLRKARTIQGDMTVQAVVKVLGQPYKQLPQERYRWIGKDYTLEGEFRVFPSGFKQSAPSGIGFTRLPEQPSAEYLALSRQVANFDRPSSYDDVVKAIGVPTKKDPATLVEYFWQAKEAVAMITFENNKVYLMANYDQPKDYYGRDHIPANR